MDDAIATCLVVLLGGGLVWFGRLRADLASLAVMLALAVPWPHEDGWHGILTPDDAFSGFGSSAVVMIAAMFVVAGAIVRTRAAEVVGERLFRAARTERQLQLAVLGVSILASMFVNDTTVVLVLLPIVLGICRERGFAPSRHLMFVAYGSLLGGQWTLIGTRSNILLSDVLRDHGYGGLGFFAFTPVAAPIALASAVVMVGLGSWLLPDTRDPREAPIRRLYRLELVVRADGPAVGRPIDLVDEVDRLGLQVLSVRRAGMLLAPGLPLEAGDVVVARAEPDAAAMAIRSPALAPMARLVQREWDPRSIDLVMVEAILPSRSWFVGQTLEGLRFEEVHGVSVVGRARRTPRPTVPLQRLPLEAGELLLLVGSTRSVERIEEGSGLALLTASHLGPMGRRRAGIVGLLLLAVIGLSATGLVTPPVSVPIAALVAVLTRCISPNDAYQSIDWPTLITLGGMIPLGRAIEQTGLAEGVAMQAVAVLSAWGPAAVVGGLLLLAVLLTQVLENTAVAIVMAPILLRVAEGLELPPEPLMVALAVTVSAGFATPFAHESTLRVMRPGRYRVRDYLTLGSALAAITWIGATLGAIGCLMP